MSLRWSECRAKPKVSKTKDKSKRRKMAKRIHVILYMLYCEAIKNRLCARYMGSGVHCAEDTGKPSPWLSYDSLAS